MINDLVPIEYDDLELFLTNLLKELNIRHTTLDTDYAHVHYNRLLEERGFAPIVFDRVYAINEEITRIVETREVISWSRSMRGEEGYKKLLETDRDAFIFTCLYEHRLKTIEDDSFFPVIRILHRALEPYLFQLDSQEYRLVTLDLISFSSALHAHIIRMVKQPYETYEDFEDHIGRCKEVYNQFEKEVFMGKFREGLITGPRVKLVIYDTWLNS